MAAFGGFSCDNLVPLLTKTDCEYMSRIGVAGQGVNSEKRTGDAWISNRGRYTITFTSTSSSPLTVVLWTWDKEDDYTANSVNVRQPKISVSLPKKGRSVTVSLDVDVTGGFSVLNAGETKLNQHGQIFNTWGEFSTGDSKANIDISEQVSSHGSAVAVTGTSRNQVHIALGDLSSGTASRRGLNDPFGGTWVVGQPVGGIRDIGGADM